LSKTFAEIFGDTPAPSESKSCSPDFIQCFEDYLREVQANIFPAKLSSVKQLILKTLWADDLLHDFPGPWIPNEQLLGSIEKATGKKYVNMHRRIHELASDSGCGLECKNDKSVSYWRIKNLHIAPPKIRENLSSKDKRILAKRFNHKCAVCDDMLEKKFQWDHKVPIARNGTNDVDNYQPLCNDCHLIKFINCKRCTKLNCKKCPLAFPEKYILSPLAASVRKP
jgi:hypothetical protein